MRDFLIVKLSDPHPVPSSALERLAERRRVDSIAPLWCAGSLDGLDAPCVAIVGTRAATALGKRRARTLGEALGRAGVCVLSGLAVGIDEAAHEGALDAGAPTIGVLGGGHRCFFPRANLGLAARMIAGGGGVLSPFPPDHPALPPQFLHRNAIVAMLADVIVVVEAASRSGALNTASWAAQLGRPVLAFPGDVERPKIAGCLGLIRDGATLVRDADDVLAALPAGTARPRRRRRARTHAAPPHDALAAAIVRTLADGERGMEALAAATSAAPAALLAALTDLELDGAVARDAGGIYALCISG